MSTEYRLDELARRGEVASTTVRLYQSKGLLSPPRLEGRVGWYDDSHLARLRLIARLQDEGHSLAGIADLLEQWEQGKSLDAVIGMEVELDSLVSAARAIDMAPADLLAHFPQDALTVENLQRAVGLGLVAPIDGGKLRVTDVRFLETGSSLAGMGVPVDVILDEWEALIAHTDDIADTFVSIFESHLAPENWREGLDSDGAHILAGTLAQLRVAARQVLLAALDASVARLGRERLGELIDGSVASRHG